MPSFVPTLEPALGQSPLTLNAYQDAAHDTAIYPEKDAVKESDAPFPFYGVLGLCGEAGEFADKLKKIIRDKNGAISEEDKVELLKELGDVLWYVAELSTQLNSDLGAVARMNLKKLWDRQARGVQGGSGDNR